MNNFDQSSSGVNIEFNCFYDTSLAQMDYDYWSEYEAKRLDFGRDSAVFLVGDSARSYYTRSQLKKLSKQAIYDLCMDYELLGYSVSLDDYKRSEYEADLLGVTIEQHYRYLIANNSWHGLQTAITHDYYISRGYSQGDAVYIISLDEPITKAMRDYIDHILWDSPITVRVRVEDKIASHEFDTEYFLDDPYKWDVDDIKNKIKVLPVCNYAKQYLIENLPTQPDY